MKVMAFNGSPRKNNNTAILLKKALAGAEELGAETELIHLYDLNYKGCRSCFACKRLGSPTYGRCAIQDDLLPIIEKAVQAEVLIFGSPIYFGTVTGEMRSFLERLLFARFAYDAEKPSLWPRKTLGAVIYTMGYHNDLKYREAFQYSLESFVERVLGSVEVLSSFDAYQFDDYAKYYGPVFDVEQKKEHYQKVFPQDCEKAYQLGQSLVQKAQTF